MREALTTIVSLTLEHACVLAHNVLGGGEICAWGMGAMVGEGGMR